MIHFAHPEAFLLALPLLLVLRWRLGERPLVSLLRGACLLAALALLARPSWSGREQGRDLILVVDRSLSIPEDAFVRVRELADFAARAARSGDRIGVVAFGRGAVVERAPEESFRPAPLQRAVDRDGTDVAQALETALALVPSGRPASLALLSDGQTTGRDPSGVAREAARRGIRVDAFPLRRAGSADVAVEDVEVPGEVAAGEPFQGSAWIRSDRAVEADVTVLRDGAVLSTSRRALRPGANRVLFRDRPIDAGLRRYEVRVEAGTDRVPENDRAFGALRVAAPSRVLCVTPGGREDRLTRSLRAAGLTVEVSAPGVAPLRPEALDGVRAVVLENVAAGDLPPGGIAALRGFVEGFGGGLLMTGGRASFGIGGYRRSPVEEVLPVSLEIRQEQRKFGIAMAIALDRSGSMAVSVAGGRTKMDLANQGACAAIELLSPIDSVSVLAVDSSPHVVVPATDVVDRAAIVRRVLRIESAGGGIFVGAALHRAADQLASAVQGSRHIVLFADAADAEEPGDYATFVPRLAEAGVTVSVIGLGSETDSDARLLREIARLGNGRCVFSSDPADLPRVFAEETIQVARSSVVEAPTAVESRAGLLSIGDLLATRVPDVGGYSIAYLKPDAQEGLRTADEQRAPFLAFRNAGLGRSAAFLGEVDGDLSGGLADWPAYGDFFATLVRWLGGSDASDAVFAEFAREGHEGVLSIEVARGDEHLLSAVRALVAGPGSDAHEVLLERVDARRLAARVPLEAPGLWRAVVEADGAVLRLPPVTLSYSPELAPRADATAGERLLARLAELSGGRVEPPVADLLSGSRTGAGSTDLTVLVAWLAVGLLLLEIAVRRLDVRVRAAWLARAIRRRPMQGRKRDRATAARGTVADRPTAAPSVHAPEAGPSETGAPIASDPPAAPPAPEEDGLSSALERAKRRARRQG